MLFGVIQTGRPALMPHSHWFILYVRRRTSDMHNMRKCLPIFKSAHQLFIHIYCYPSFEKSVLVNMCIPIVGFSCTLLFPSDLPKSLKYLKLLVGPSDVVGRGFHWAFRRRNCPYMAFLTSDIGRRTQCE